MAGGPDAINNSCYKFNSILAPPHFYTDASRKFKGYVSNLVNEAAIKYNFCYTVEVAPRSATLALYIPQNDSFVGVVRDFEEKNVQAFLFPASPIGPEFRKFDVTDYFDIERTGAMYKYPKIEPDFTGFVKPFTLKLWTILLFMVAGLVLFDYAIQKLSHRMRLVSAANSREPFFKATMITWMILMAQAIRIPSNASQQVFIGFWLVVSLLIGMCYKCNLQATLILPKVVIPFRNLHELVNQDNIGWALVRGGGLIQAAKGAPEGTDFRKLYDKKHKEVLSLEEVDPGIKTGEFGFVVAESVVFGYFASRYKKYGYCVATMMEETFWPRSLYLYCKKGSPIKNMFNTIIKRFREAGILEAWKKMEFREGLSCMKNIGKDDLGKLRPLQIRDLWGIFLILGTGLTLATFSFIAEVVIGSRRHK